MLAAPGPPAADEDVLRDEGEAYARALEQSGVPARLRPLEGTIHGFWRGQAAAEIARATVADVAAALRAALD